MCEIGDMIAVIEPVIAYRIFCKYAGDVVGEDPMYGSMHMCLGERYSMGVLLKADEKPNKSDRLWAKQHGFWAYDTFNKARHKLAEYSRNRWCYINPVLCKVQLMGKIVKHKRGYRAEYMIILKEYKTK